MKLNLVKMLSNFLIASVSLGVLVFLLAPTGHVRPFYASEASAKSLFNALSSYAWDHEGMFPETADGEFLDECIRLGYLTESNWRSCTLKGAPPGSTGFYYFKGLRQTSRGSELLLISEQPILDPTERPHYITLAICGRAEAKTCEDLVSLLAYKIRQKSEDNRDTSDQDKS